MTTLLIGFDSAWTPKRSGALVGVLREGDGSLTEIGDARVVDFASAERFVASWRDEYAPERTLVLLDQPTIVMNPAGQRPVENLVASPVSLRFGGVQPANTGRAAMFGLAAPVWSFLSSLDGGLSPWESWSDALVLETYPVLTHIALDWLLPSDRSAGRLPKYNPARRKTFSQDDWRFVCERLVESFEGRGLVGLLAWCKATSSARPRKSDQDIVDACVCLLVALHLAEGGAGLCVGERSTGLMVVPYGDRLARELEDRATRTGRDPSTWVRGFRLAPVVA